MPAATPIDRPFSQSRYGGLGRRKASINHMLFAVSQTASQHRCLMRSAGLLQVGVRAVPRRHVR